MSRRLDGAEVVGDAPLAEYRFIYTNRTWMFPAVLAWSIVVLAVLVALVMNHLVIAAVPYKNAIIVVVALGLMGSLLMPSLLLMSRRHWTLFGDRVDIEERPYLPVLGRQRWVSMPFEDIAKARMTELIGGLQVFDIVSRSGARYRLSPAFTGSGKTARPDQEGFDRYVAAISAAMEAAGKKVPLGETEKTVWDTTAGIVFLALIAALPVIGLLIGTWLLVVERDRVGMSFIALGLPLSMYFGGILLDRLRKWRAAREAL